MIRYKLYDAAGPTPSFLGNTTAPEVDDVSETRIVETSTFLDGRFEGDTLRVEFIGRFDFDRSIAKVDELRVFVDGERHERLEFDRPLDVFDRDFGWVLAAAAERGVHFTGNRYANHFSGDVGDDRLMGGGGDDRLEGSSGDDLLRGGVGTDRLIAGWGRDHLTGGDGDDRLTDDGGDDVLRGGAGADRLIDEWGKDRLEGGDGADRLTDKRGNDRLAGGRGDDWLRDFEGNDVLRGGGGTDLLLGGYGNDRLVGGPGDDRLIGGYGVDELTGGGGADVFVLHDGRDRVTDFRPGRDLIDLSRIDAQMDRYRDQSFLFIGEEAFSDSPGELRFEDGRLIGNPGEYEFSRFVIELPGVETLSEADLLL